MLPRLLLLATLAFPAYAQDLPRFAETVEVHVFNLEAVARDRSGKLIDDLTANDFTVLADGKPVPLSNFQNVRRGVLLEEATSSLEPPREGPEPGSERLTWAVFVDQRGRPALRSDALRQVHDMLVRSVAPGDRGTVGAFIGHTLHLVTPMTSADETFLASLARSRRFAAPAGPLDMRAAALRSEIEGGSPRDARSLADELAVIIEEEAHRTLAAIRSFESFVGMLGGVEGRAVALYVGPGFTTIPAFSLVEQWRAKFPQAAQQGWAPDPEEKVAHLNLAIEHLQQAIAASGVTCYTVYAGDRHGGLPGVEDTQLGVDGPMKGDYDQWTSMGQARWMAERSGGRLFTLNPSLSRQLAVIDEEMSNYYLLGFSAVSASGKPVRVRVTVSVDGATVQHRETVRRRTAHEEAESEVLTSLFDDVGVANPLGVVATTGTRVERRGRVTIPVRLEIPVVALEWVPDGEVARASLSFHFGIAGDDGSVWRLESRALAPERSLDDREQTADATVSYSVELPLPKGAARIAVLVEDRFAGTRSKLLVLVETRSRRGR